MHIITGVILASLLKKGQGNKAPSAPLLRLHTPVRTCHLLPGRVRFAVPALKGNKDAADRLTSALKRVQAIDLVAVNTISGSVVIRFNPEQISAELLVAAIIKVLGLEKELERIPASVLGREIHHVAHALNRAVYDQTQGLMDLRTALLLAMAGLGTIKLLQHRQLALPAAFTLLWWAGDGLFRSTERS